MLREKLASDVNIRAMIDIDSRLKAIKDRDSAMADRSLLDRTANMIKSTLDTAWQMVLLA